MTKDEALRLALEALELVSIEFVCNGAHHAKKDRHEWLDPCPIVDRYKEAITAIKAALEAKDEPVPVAIVEVFGKDWRLDYMALPVGKHKLYAQQYTYTTPPQRTWVGLDDDDRHELWESTDSEWALMKRVEAKLKEKNT